MWRDPESIERASLWKVRAAMFVGACLLHVMGANFILVAQTSCTVYPCVDALAFDVVRAVWIFPLFYTPWVDFPAQELEYVRNLRLFGWFWLNAAAECALAVVAWLAGRRGWAWWGARRVVGPA